MKYCSQCGQQLDDSANFCPSCGAKQHIDSKLDESFYDNGYQQNDTSYYQPINNETENHSSNDIFGDLSSENNRTEANNEQQNEEKKNKSERDTAIIALILAFFIPIAGFIIGIKGTKDIKDTNSKYYKMCVAAIVVSIISFISYILGIIF